MLTGFAILERELGSIDYQLHRLRLDARRGPPLTEGARAQARDLERRRVLVLDRLDELHDQWAERPAPDAGARLRARRPGRTNDA